MRSIITNGIEQGASDMQFDPYEGDLRVRYEPVGCERCRSTGYRGRVGLFEVMSVSEEIRALVVARAPAGEIARLAIEQGMTTLHDDGLAKVRGGETTLAELARVVG